MQRRGLRECRPRLDDPAMPRLPSIDFSSGYIQRSLHLLPSQGDRAPWRLHQNYALDLLGLRYGAVTDRAMQFSR
jgi:hypothetical protein